MRQSSKFATVVLIFGPVLWLPKFRAHHVEIAGIQEALSI